MELSDFAHSVTLQEEERRWIPVVVTDEDTTKKDWFWEMDRLDKGIGHSNTLHWGPLGSCRHCKSRKGFITASSGDRTEHHPM